VKPFKPAKYTIEAASVVVRRWLDPGDSVLEIGAADGAHAALYAAYVGALGSVVAVEPLPAPVAQLRVLRELFPWLVVLPVAVGASSGEAVLTSDRARPRCSSLYAENVGELGPVFPVPVTTLDVIVRAMSGGPDLIHLDAQGAEAAILRGASRTLALPIPWIVELWRDGLEAADATIDDVLEPFRERGFVAQTVNGEPWAWPALRAEAESRRGASYCDAVMIPEVSA